MALEEAAGEAKKALGLGDDYKYKVSLTLYYPSTHVTSFGDVDGDGVSENLSKISDRFKVMEWYIKKIRATFDEKNGRFFISSATSGAAVIACSEISSVTLTICIAPKRYKRISLRKTTTATT